VDFNPVIKIVDCNPVIHFLLPCVLLLIFLFFQVNYFCLHLFCQFIPIAFLCSFIFCYSLSFLTFFLFFFPLIIFLVFYYVFSVLVCCSLFLFSFVFLRLYTLILPLLSSLSFLGAFAKLRKATISFVMSVCLSAPSSVCVSGRMNYSARTGRIFIKVCI